MNKALCDHLLWMFKPGKFLFYPESPKTLHVKGFETICFVDQQVEVASVNKATGDLFLGGAGNEFLVALLGHQSSFALDGEQHRLARKIISPWLTAKRMAEKQPEIDAIISNSLDTWVSSKSYDVGNWARWTNNADSMQYRTRYS